MKSSYFQQIAASFGFAMLFSALAGYCLLAGYPAAALTACCFVVSFSALMIAEAIVYLR
jgi:hypothetical protein